MARLVNDIYHLLSHTINAIVMKKQTHPPWDSHGMVLLAHVTSLQFHIHFCIETSLYSFKTSDMLKAFLIH